MLVQLFQSKPKIIPKTYFHINHVIFFIHKVSSLQSDTKIRFKTYFHINHAMFYNFYANLSHYKVYISSQDIFINVF